MSKPKKISRLALARKLQDLALRIAANQPIRLGGQVVRIPDHVLLEQEFECAKGICELEWEIQWPAAPTSPPTRRASRRR